MSAFAVVWTTTDPGEPTVQVYGPYPSHSDTRDDVRELTARSGHVCVQVLPLRGRVTDPPPVEAGASPYLYAKDVAALTGVDVKTVHRWRAEGRRGPAAIKVGGRWRYRAAEVREWLAAGEGT